MTIKLPKRAILLCSVVLATWTIGTIPVTGQRWWHQGVTWLKWKHDVRQAYVFGYIVAYSNGHEDGCIQGAKHSAGAVKLEVENDPKAKCSQQELDFSKGSDYFVKAITDFYTRYPEDREIDIGEVLHLFGKGLTLEQVHNHPFPRHNAPNTKP